MEKQFSEGLDNVYLFCLEYHYNHKVKLDRNIMKYANDYNSLLGYTIDKPQDFKRLYTLFYEESVEWQNYNLNWLEQKLMNDIKQEEPNDFEIENSEDVKEFFEEEEKPKKGLSKPVIAKKARKTLEFESITKAEKFIKKKGISTAIKEKKALGGYIWSFKN